MEQRFTFIKTNEVADSEFTQEERVELEVTVEEDDFDALADKLTNFLAGCGYHDVFVEINQKDEEEEFDDDEEYEGGVEQTD
jgi:hypothetical protein|tara:strand:- start:18 stop:263 length:246 start_codon:yes stop_codon:yes gene_type:complete